MEAWIEISCFILSAADHTSGPGAIRGLALGALDREEGPGVEVVREPVTNLSVVITRLSIRSLNWEFTTNKPNRQSTVPQKRGHPPETISAGTSLGSL